MKRGASGTYDSATVAGEQVRAFVPDPLPPMPPLDVTGQRQLLLERALLAGGRLDGISALLPDPDLFLYTYIRREAVLSSQIEGTQSSLSDLLQYELGEAPGVPLNDVVEVVNHVSALEHGVLRLQSGFPLSIRLLREVHEKLLVHGRGADKEPGSFRTSQNWIGGTRPGNAHFVPPPFHLVAPCMADLERFLHASGDGISALVRAGLAHVQFETIHPFLDGNGRVGRLLIALILFDAQVLAQPLLYLSLYFKQHREEYYTLLDAVRTQGRWEEWIDFFLEGVAITAESAVSTAHRLLGLFRDDSTRVQETGRSVSNLLHIYDAFRRRPVASVKLIMERTGASYPTVARAIGRLGDMGIIHEITGRKRDRVYAYSQYLGILNEGTEPA